MAGDAKVKMFEKVRDAGEEAHASDSQLVGLMKKRSNEPAACAMACRSRKNGDGAHFGEVWAVDVERGTTDESIRLCFSDGEGVDVFADLHAEAREERSIVRETFDQTIDIRSVLQSRGPRSHQGFLVKAVCTALRGAGGVSHF